MRKTITIVIGKKSSINHIRIGKNNVGFLTNSTSFVGRSISIVNTSLYAIFSKVFYKFYNVSKLIFRQCFCRIDKHSSSTWIFEYALNYRKIKRKRFSAGCPCSNHHRISLHCLFIHFSLMRIQFFVAHLLNAIF